MPLDDVLVKQLVVDLLKNPSERDGQRLIGASEIGNPCAHCLAERLLNVPRGRSRYWMGARIGTAIHAALEEEGRNADTGTYRFAALEGARFEESITLGKIPGYGTIRSKPDLALVSERHVFDYKTSTRDKIKHYKLDGVPEQYIYQQQLYAWGLTQAGIPIEKISLVFIQRDGLTDDDIWVYSFDYNESVALHAWERLNKIWAWLQEPGNTPDGLDSSPDCYYCRNVLHRV
jgi:hypothetical protein